jgi:hypothetical protein
VLGRVLPPAPRTRAAADAGQVVTAFALSRDGKKAALVMQSAIPSEAYASTSAPSRCA